MNRTGQRLAGAVGIVATSLMAGFRVERSRMSIEGASVLRTL